MIDAYNAADESNREGHTVGAHVENNLPAYLFKSGKGRYDRPSTNAPLAACADMDFTYRAPARLVYPPARPPLTDEEFIYFIEHFNDGESDAGYVNDYQPEYLGRDEYDRSVWG
jgi:hypothetical protein